MSACPECGAAVPAGGSCRDSFHALLALEWEIPGGPGDVAHFYAVASYGLQHPESMGYTAGSVDGLRRALSDVLAGVVTIEDVRRRTRRAVREAGRVTRRDGDDVPRWPIDQWPIVVTDVVDGGPRGYAERVEHWARSVVTTIDGLRT